MTDQKKTRRIPLGEPIQSLLADFRAANYNATEIEIIREALKDHIERRLREPEIRKRFDTARLVRLKASEKPLSIVKSDKND